jgi:hypothetical protein
MLSYDKQLRGLSQRLRRNMMELLMIYKSPLAPLFQRGEEKDPHDYAKTPFFKEGFSPRPALRRVRRGERVAEETRQAGMTGVQKDIYGTGP